MKKTLTFILCILIFAFTASAELRLGDAFPDFTAELSDGSVFNLYDALSTHDAVMINIWASWCPPCRAELPFIEQAYSEYSEKVAVVCLSAFDSNEDIAAFKEQNGLTILPMGCDSIGLTSALVTRGYPTTVIVDRFGVYALYECGALPAPGYFTYLWDMYLGEDYTESYVCIVE